MPPSDKQNGNDSKQDGTNPAKNTRASRGTGTGKKASKGSTTGKSDAFASSLNPDSRARQVVDDIEKTLFKYQKGGKVADEIKETFNSYKKLDIVEKTFSTYRNAWQGEKKPDPQDTIRPQVISQRLKSLQPDEGPPPKAYERPKARFNFDQLTLAGCLVGLGILIFVASQTLSTGSAKDHLASGLAALKSGKLSLAEDELSLALKADPKLMKAYMYRAMTRTRLDKTDGALSDYNEFLNSDQHNAVAFSGRAYVHLKRMELDEAKADSHKALEIDPTYVDALQVLGAASAKSGDYAQSIEDCTKFLNQAGTQSNGPETAQALSTRAFAYLKSGKLEKALDDYDKAISLDKSNGLLYASRAEVHRQTHNWKRGLDDANRAINLSPEVTSTYKARALCLAAMGKVDKALLDLDTAIKLDPQDVELYKVRGDIKLSNRKFAGALADFEYVLRVQPNNRAILERYDRAKQHIAHSTQSLPLESVTGIESSSSPKPVALKGDLVAQGYALLQQGSVGEAISVLSAAVKNNPTDARARRYLAHACFMSGNMSMAAQQFKALKQLQVLDQQDVIRLAEALDSDNQREEALETYEQYLSSYPGCTAVRLKLLDMYERAGFARKASKTANDGVPYARNNQEKALLLERAKGGKRSEITLPPGEVIPPKNDHKKDLG